jgi:cobalamin biosynthesis protein CobD/CbiB
LQLGGLNFYDGEPHAGALIGDPNEPLTREHIERANALMLGTASLALLLFLGARVLVVTWIGGGAA